MYKTIPIPHNYRVPAKYSMAIPSYGILEYQLFYDKILSLIEYYKSTDYEIVLVEFGINRSGQEGKFYARIYMNDIEKSPPPEVGTIIPTLGNIIETNDILLLKARTHE